MIVLLIVSVVVICLVLLYVLSTMCRTGKRRTDCLCGHAYAHRGLHGAEVPENSMEAFKRAKAAGYGVELDVHLLADGNLAVLHDSSLLRMTGSEGRIEELKTEQLADFLLAGTNECIPLFSDILSHFSSEVPVIVELKARGGNYKELCRKACEMMDTYNGIYCMESFDPRCVYWLRKNRPDIIRGQLTENYFVSTNVKLPWILKIALVHQAFNFLTRPDFVAYRFGDRKTLSNVLVRKLWRTQGVAWTLTSQEEYDVATSENWIPIFEGFCP